MKKKGIIMALAAALCVAAFAPAAMAVTNETDLRTAITSGGTVTLEQDIALTSGSLEIKDGNTVILDLNGYTLSRESSEDANTYVIEVSGGATLTINDSNSTGNGGKIISTNTHTSSATDGHARGIRIGGESFSDDDSTPGTVIMNGGTIRASTGYGVALYANNSGKSEASYAEEIATVFTMTGGKIEAGVYGVAAFGRKATVNIQGGEIAAVDGAAVSGNGQDGNNNSGGTEINISGGILKSQNSVAIYHPQAGVLNVSDGEITGVDGIQMKAGTLVVNGGVITGEGTKGAIGSSDGNDETGAAVSIISVGGESGSYAGDINATFNGGTLISEQENAIFEAQADGAVTKFESLTITGGTFTGAEGKDAMSMTNVTTDENGVSNTNITGGTFSSNPNECQGMENANIAEGTLDENGNYVISAPAPAPAPSAPQHSGGGGCSAGFGALALLAVVPLLRMRKR